MPHMLTSSFDLRSEAGAWAAFDIRGGKARSAEQRARHLGQTFIIGDVGERQETFGDIIARIEGSSCREALPHVAARARKVAEPPVHFCQIVLGVRAVKLFAKFALDFQCLD